MRKRSPMEVPKRVGTPGSGPGCAQAAVWVGSCRLACVSMVAIRRVRGCRGLVVLEDGGSLCGDEIDGSVGFGCDGVGLVWIGGAVRRHHHSGPHWWDGLPRAGSVQALLDWDTLQKQLRRCSVTEESER